MNIYTKLPSTTESFAFDFSHLLATAETISSIVGITQEESGEASGGLTVSGETIAGETVTCLAAGGTTRKVYVLTCKIATSASQLLAVQGAIAIG